MAIVANFEANFDQFVAAANKANASLDQIEGTSKSVMAAVDDLKSGAETLAGAFGVAFSVGAAVEFLGSVVASATALNNLSQQTHINVEDLQLLASAMSEFGVDADTLGKGLYRLSRGIAGGDDSVARGLALMGIALKDVDGLNGQELFLKVEAGLATLQGGLRDTAATDLFGSKLGMAMAGASEGIVAATDRARELNTVMSQESVKSLAEYEDAINRTKTSLSAMAANLIGPLAQEFLVLNDAVDRGASKWAIFSAVLPKGFGGFGQAAGDLTKLLDDLNQKTEANAKAVRDAAAAHGDITKAIDTRTDAERFMATLEANAAVALNATQLANLEHLKDIGELNVKNAAGIGVNAAQFAKYSAEMTASAAAAKEFQDATERVDAVGETWRDTLAGINPGLVAYAQQLLAAGANAKDVGIVLGLLPPVMTAIDLKTKDATTSLKDHAAQLAIVTALWADYDVEITKLSGTEMDQAFATLNAGFEKTAAAEQKLIDEGKVSAADQVAFWTAFAAKWSAAINGLSVDTAALTKTASTETQVGLQQIADKAQATYEAALAHAGEWRDGTIQAYRDTADAAQQAADTFGTGFVTNAAKALDAIQKVSAAQKSASTFSLVGSATPVGIHGKLSQADLLVYGYIDPKGNITPSGAQAGYGEAGTFSARAAGGPVTAGESYLVGERGPELYTPGASGFITPNGGGLTQNIVIHVNGTVAEVAQKVSAEIMRTFNAGMKR